MVHFCASDLIIRSRPHGSFWCVRSDHPIAAMWLFSVRQIRLLDRCHVVYFRALDPAIQSMPRGSFFASDLTVLLVPRDSFLCIGSSQTICATLLFSARRLWPSSLRRDSPSHVGSIWLSLAFRGIIQVTNKYW